MFSLLIITNNFNFCKIKLTNSKQTAAPVKGWNFKGITWQTKIKIEHSVFQWGLNFNFNCALKSFAIWECNVCNYYEVCCNVTMKYRHAVKPASGDARSADILLDEQNDDINV